MPPPIWQHRVQGQIVRAFIQVSAGKVIFEYWPEVKGTQLHVLDDVSGETAWTSAIDGIDDFFVLDGHIFSGGDRARCFSIESGSILAESPREAVSIRPPVPEGPVFFRLEAQQLTVLDPHTLDPIWAFADPDEAWTVHGDTICRRATVEIIVRNRFTQEEVARMPARQRAGAAAHVHCGQLWCEFGVSRGGRRGYDLVARKLAWEAETPGGYDLPAFDGTFAYAASDGLVAYDLRSGGSVWRQALDAEVSTGGVHIRDGLLSIGTKGHVVYVLEAATGRILRRLDVTFEPRAVQLLDGGRLLVTSDDTLFCFGPD